VEIEEVFARFRVLKHALRIPKRSTSTWFGEHRSAFHGSGYDITGVERWRSGQPLKDVAWRLSLRTYPERLFKIERMEQKQLPLLLAVDLSHSMLFEISQDSNKALLLLDLIGGLGLTRARLHDPVGMVAFSDRIELFLKPKLGTSQVFRMAHEIFDKLQFAREYPSSRPADLSVALRFLAARLKMRHSIVIISDLLDLMADHESFDFQLMRRLASKHDVTVLVLDDPEEFNVPGRFGFLRIANMESGRQTVIPVRKTRAIRRDIEASIAAIRACLKRECGVDSVVLTPAQDNVLFNVLVARNSP
jgi:uncharacterized protein (DUF58 family)